MTVTARPRHPDAGWIAVVIAAICAGLHVWDLPAAIPFLRHDMGVTLVQAGTLLGVVQVAGLVGGLPSHCSPNWPASGAACWQAWQWRAWGRRSAPSPAR